VTKEPRSRAAWGSISREQVVDAAARAVSEGRYEEMSIRSLAGELGVAPMSLYHYVRDKDDLLDEVVDRMLSSVWQPDADDGDWLAWVAEAATRLREFLIDQPAALHVYLLHPPLSPAASTRMEAMLRVLQGAGLDEEEAHRAYAAVQVYTVGFAALEASRARWLSTNTSSDPRFQELAALTSPRQFAEGLGYLLEGIKRPCLSG
jgi:AcrR family transcriptional regulator